MALFILNGGDEKVDLISIEDNQIKLEILKKVQVGQLINYTEFLELYEPYKGKLSEIDFAEILGISYNSYICIKNKKQRTRIKNYKVIKIINRIKFLLKESRYYSKQELENISETYKINLTELLQLIFNINNSNDVFNLIETLMKNGQLWIGNVRCSKIFAEQYAEYMISIARTKVK